MLLHSTAYQKVSAAPVMVTSNLQDMKRIGRSVHNKRQCKQEPSTSTVYPLVLASTIECTGKEVEEGKETVYRL